MRFRHARGQRKVAGRGSGSGSGQARSLAAGRVPRRSTSMNAEDEELARRLADLIVQAEGIAEVLAGLSRVDPGRSLPWDGGAARGQESDKGTPEGFARPDGPDRGFGVTTHESTGMKRREAP